MGTISEQIRVEGKKKKKTLMAVIAIVLAVVIAGVAIFFVIKENKKPKIISYQGEIANYFRTYKMTYKNPSPDLIEADEAKSAEIITKMTDPRMPDKDDKYTLYPKQKVKIIKIAGIFWWEPNNRTELEMRELPDTFVTTIFTENFRVNKNEDMEREVEITPSSCRWLKEVMTPDDALWFFDDANGKRSYTIQITNLQITFSLA